MRWQVERFENTEPFDSAVREYLMQREAIHNVQLGLLETLQTNPERYPGENFLGCVRREGTIEGVAMRTPPHPALLSVSRDDEATTLLVEALTEAYPDLDGVTVPETAAPFALRALETKGYATEIAARERLFQTSAADPPAVVVGRARAADDGDRELVTDWSERFKAAVGDPDLSDAAVRQRIRERTTSMIDDEDVCLWCVDDRPVSMAIRVARTPNGARIGGVYTPPEKRSNGYASAVTAELTRRVLQGDREFCFLFTDLADDITNEIYPAIGYEPVADQLKYDLEPPT